ncbi:hypothetical protein AwWohl_01180 [Gammaproteobacteria bacterium]|nr:hypothetical protein AwWohl_01180 [Gammaproteobacteria bacterium]
MYKALTRIVFLSSVTALALTIASAKPTVEINTNYGNILIELADKEAPITVKNFLEYAENGHYEDTIFHRVIKGFMIQGGGFSPNMVQKTTLAPIKIESMNGLKNDLGTIAMARTGNPNSATNQFFINTKDNEFLNYTAANSEGYGYTVFGKVIEGMDVITTIENLNTSNQDGHQDVPITQVIIRKITILHDEVDDMPSNHINEATQEETSADSSNTDKILY